MIKCVNVMVKTVPMKHDLKIKHSPFRDMGKKCIGKTGLQIHTVIIQSEP